MTAWRALAAWPGPALVAAVVAAVAAGAAAAPLLVLAAAVAPLLALLQARRAATPAHPVTLLITAAVSALLLWAHLAVLADVATLLGARRWQGSVLAAALALLVTQMPGAERWRGLALAAGGGALLFVLVAAGTAMGITPWAAWREAAGRPALVFSGRSAWVTDGQRFVRHATLAFDEAHRVVAVTPGTFRVVERDGARRVVRDWGLAAGDALSVRPGDTLTAEPGSRLRFEPGKRVPGAAASGSAWADAATRVSPAPALGVLATLALGACALVPAGVRRMAAAPALPLVLSLGAASWGVYATLAAPEAGLAGSPAGALLSLARATSQPAAGLCERVGAAAGGHRPTLWTLSLVAAAIAATVPAVDPWTPLAAGLGLAGAAVAAPRLAGAEGARIGPWPASVVGGVAGAAVFAGLVALGARLPGPAASLREVPVLAAAPAAWLVVKVLRRAAAGAS